MNTLLCILKAIVNNRAALFPAVVGFISAFAAALGWHIDIGKMQTLVNATGLLATPLAAIVGAALDAKNREVKAAIKTNAETINANAGQLDSVTGPGVISAKVPDIKPCDPTPPENP